MRTDIYRTDRTPRQKPFVNVFVAFIVIGLAFLSFGFLAGGKAHAETNTPIAADAPTPNSGTTGGGTNFTPLTGVGRGSFNGQWMWYKVYVRVGQATTITVNQTCNDVGSPTARYRLYSLSDREKDNAGNTWGNYKDYGSQDSSDCTVNKSFDIGQFAGTPSSIAGHTDYRVFAFIAEMLAGPGSAERYFHVQSSNSGSGNSYVGLAVHDLSGTYPLNYSTIYKPSGTWGASVMFAPSCGSPISQPESIKVFDADNGIYQTSPPYMHAYLERSDAVAYMNNGAINWSTQTSWDGQTVQGVPNGYQMGQSNTIGTLNFQASNNYIYKFHVVGSNYPNTIQIQLPFDQFDAKQTARQGCLPAVTCTATASPSGITPGGSSTITINGSSSGGPWKNSYYLRRSSPSYKDISSPGTNTGTDTVTPAATTVYIYFVASSNPDFTTNGLVGGPAIHSTPCQVTVTVGNIAFDAECNYTTVAMKTTASDYYDQPVASGYWTAKAPDVNSTPFQYPHIWNNTAPPNNTNDIKNDTPKPVPGQDYSLNPGIGGLLIWYYWVGTVRHLENPASEIPMYIQWQDSGGNNVGGPQTYMIKPTSGGKGSHTFNTYVDINPGLIPHNAYTAILFAQISGSFAKDSGSYQYSQVATSPLHKCLDANPATVCVPGSGVSGAIGTTVTLSYSILIDNQTLKVFPNNFGYNMNFVLGPGLQPSGPTSSNLQIPTGQNKLTGTIQVTIIYSDSFSIQFRYGSTVLAYQLLSGNWDAQCGGGSVTANILPYVQAWNSDVSAGGGFRSSVSGSGSCGGSGDAPYISPVNSGDQNSGGIRAFSQQNFPNRGSRVDFGALALGYIIGSPGGPAGFYSGDGAAGDHADFANKLSGYFSTNMGGYLNSNSDSHCVNDYFTDTRATTSNSPTGNLAGDVVQCQNTDKRCQYDFSNLNLTSGTPVTIPAGVQITEYVDGDVTIDSNITYAPFNPTDPSNVPYFALIVRGNITLTNNVTRLDGLFIAQPKLSGASWTKGQFVTCDDNAGNYCNNQLVVNGAVIAQHLQLLRNHGTLYNPPAADAAITGNPAEIFNFTPSLIIGSPAFASLSILPPTISLPPVF